MDHRDQALHRVLTLLEDSEPWARNFLRTPPPRLVDLDRMAASIVDSLEVIRGTKARLSPDGPEKT
jgi:hypothetical protein